LSARSYQLLVIAMMLAAGGRARADAHGVLRIGVMPLALEPSTDTPLFGGYFDDAVRGYNAAAMAYDRAHDTNSVTPIDRSALGVHATMMTFAPGLEVGGEHAVFRLEGIFGISDTHRMIGLGVYPIDLAWRGAYIAIGGTASSLDRTDTDGETGALVTARAAAGVRVGRVSLEIGYGMYVAGGLVDSGQLHSMQHYDPRGAPPPAADSVVAGGEQHGMIDVAVGVGL
jgi:hypothetical protein